MLALEGIKILDLTWQGPGPHGTMILGDLGAEVTRIGAPPTAEARQPKETTAPRVVAHQTANRNKKYILLNLKTPPGRQIFHQLARQTDVILESFRPGVTQRLGIDYPTINKMNPGIIYCSISGYGQDGPYRDLPGHDINYISFGGALSLIGEAGRPPVIPLSMVADYGAMSKDAVIGILTALIARQKTSQGQYLDLSLTDSVISLLTEIAWNNYFLTGAVPERGKHHMGGAAPYYNVYQTADGNFITIGCTEPWLWANLCRAIGKEDFIPFNMTRWRAQRPADQAKWQEIAAYLRQLFLTRSRDEWFERLRHQDVPISKVYTLDEVFTDPQVRQRQMVIEIEHPTEGAIKQVGIAIKLSDTPGAVRSLPPAPGEHTRETLSGLGYTEQQIAELYQQGVVG